MLQQVQEFNHFRLATLTDIKYLAPRLRFEDKREILASSRYDTLEHLHYLLFFRFSFYDCKYKNEPVAIFGVMMQEIWWNYGY